MRAGEVADGKLEFCVRVDLRRRLGSGIVVPGTGISLQNRGAGFVLERNHPNYVGPNKRPFHTIIPGFLTRGGQPVMSFGVIGGFVQPQIQAQFVIRLRD